MNIQYNFWPLKGGVRIQALSSNLVIPLGGEALNLWGPKSTGEHVMCVTLALAYAPHTYIMQLCIIVINNVFLLKQRLYEPTSMRYPEESESQA